MIIDTVIKSLNAICACVLDSRYDDNKGYVTYIFGNCYHIVILKNNKTKVKTYKTFPNFTKYKDNWIAKNY